MAQNGENILRISELNSLFLSLDNKGQDSALTILRSLSFAQSVTDLAKQAEPSPKTTKKALIQTDS